MHATVETNGSDETGSGLGFNELLLGAVITFMVVSLVLAGVFYLRPGEHLEIPEIQPVVRVASEPDFPVGASRLVRWGDRPILVVRQTDERFLAVQGTAPSDGCLLQWEAEALRIVSPCSFVVYDVDGSAVAGLSTQPLQRYPVFVRDGIVYVARS
jgi:nitrite reductase/ring-hydroxylating ferredoxin subunit